MIIDKNRQVTSMSTQFQPLQIPKLPIFKLKKIEAQHLLMKPSKGKDVIAPTIENVKNESIHCLKDQENEKKILARPQRLSKIN